MTDSMDSVLGSKALLGVFVHLVRASHSSCSWRFLLLKFTPRNQEHSKAYSPNSKESKRKDTKKKQKIKSKQHKKHRSADHYHTELSLPLDYTIKILVLPTYENLNYHWKAIGVRFWTGNVNNEMKWEVHTAFALYLLVLFWYLAWSKMWKYF